MAQYKITYFMGDQPNNPEEAQNLRGKWEGWMKDLGEAMINPGTPLGSPITVTQDGTSENQGKVNACGFSVVEAPDIEAALVIAKSCPHLYIGHVDVAEIKSMC